MNLLAILFLFASPIHAEPIKAWQQTILNEFCGINTNNDSSMIKDCEAQDAVNVLTDSNYLEKRPGNVKIATASYNNAVKNLGEFVSSANTRYILAHSSNTVYAIDTSGNVVTVTTVTTGSDVEFTQAYNNALIVDGSAGMVSWDGTSTTTIYAAPICKYVSFDHDRVYCGAVSSNLSQVAVSSFGTSGYWTISVSVPLPDQSPTTFDFQKNDGDQINCMKVTPWGLFVAKKNSSHILKGYGNNTWYKLVIDPVIGCIDNRTVQMVNGLLVWAAPHGIYAWDGGHPPRWISQNINAEYLTSRQLSSNKNFWQVATKADWDLGSPTLNGPTSSWSSSIQSGSLIPSSVTFLDNNTTTYLLDALNRLYIATDNTNVLIVSSNVFQDNFGDGDYTANPSWTVASPGGALDYVINTNTSDCLNGAKCLASNNNGVRSIYATSTSSTGSWTWTQLIGLNRNGGFKFISGDNAFAGGNGYGVDANISANVLTGTLTKYPSGTALCSLTDSSQNWNLLNQNWRVLRNASGNFEMDLYNGSQTFLSSCTATDNSYTASSFVIYETTGTSQSITGIYNFAYQSSATMFSSIYDTTFSTPIGGPFTASSSVPNGDTLAYQTRSGRTAVPDGTWTSWKTITYGNKIQEQNRYVQFMSSFTNAQSTDTLKAGSFQMPFVSSGIYYSPVHQISSAQTAWANWDATDGQLPGGIFAYSTRDSNNIFTSLSSTPPWVSQSNHVTVAASTGTYFQYKIDSSGITSSSDTMFVTRTIANWSEGSASSRPASGVNLQRYFLCMTISTMIAVPDTCFVWQRNQQWVKWMGPSIGSMGIYNTNLIAGSGGVDSSIWNIMKRGVYDDDGQPISAYWITKDFTLGSVFTDKVLREMWVDSNYLTGGTINIGFSMAKNPAFTTKSVALDAITNITSQRVPLDSGFAIGRYIKFKFSDATVSQYMRLNAFGFYTDVQQRSFQ